MSSNIPAARKLLQEALKMNRTSAEMRGLIHMALKLMVRDRYKPITAKARHPSLTPELAHRIRLYVARVPNASTLQVAELFGVNPGRVSEALSGEKG